MARTRTGTRRTGSTKKTQAAIRRAALIDIPPKRGVKLKHFSSFIMLVALLCLFAYLAGRVDVSAATSAPAQERGVARASLVPDRIGDTKEPHMFLGLRTVKYDVQDMAKAKD